MRKLHGGRSGACCSLAAIGVLAGVAVLGGCSFGHASAHPDAAPTSSSAVPTNAATTSPAAPTPVAAADLVASTNGRPASLAVATSAPQRGVPPLEAQDGTLAADCHLSPDAAEYETLSVGFTDRGPADTKADDEAPNLRVDVAAPEGSGVGVFVKDTAGIYCQGAATMPTSTTMQTQDMAEGHQTFTVYVIARTGAAAPDPLHGVTVELHNLRKHPDDINPRTWTWTVQKVTAGSQCPGDPNSLCVPLA